MTCNVLHSIYNFANYVAMCYLDFLVLLCVSQHVRMVHARVMKIHTIFDVKMNVICR